MRFLLQRTRKARMIDRLSCIAVAAAFLMGAITQAQAQTSTHSLCYPFSRCLLSVWMLHQLQGSSPVPRVINCYYPDQRFQKCSEDFSSETANPMALSFVTLCENLWGEWRPPIFIELSHVLSVKVQCARELTVSRGLASHSATPHTLPTSCLRTNVCVIPGGKR